MGGNALRVFCTVEALPHMCIQLQRKDSMVRQSIKGRQLPMPCMDKLHMQMAVTA